MLAGSRWRCGWRRRLAWCCLWLLGLVPGLFRHIGLDCHAPRRLIPGLLDWCYRMCRAAPSVFRPFVTSARGESLHVLVELSAPSAALSRSFDLRCGHPPLRSSLGLRDGACGLGLIVAH